MEQNLMMSIKDIPVDIGLMSDDDDDIGEEESFSASELLHSSLQDAVSSSLVGSGTMSGLAAAAALVTSRKRHRPYKFELNPSTRKRQHTRLIRKLKQTIHELCTRCGQQAVVLCVSPGKDNPSFRVFGSSPLDQVVKNCQGIIFRDLERELQDKLPASLDGSGELFELPPLMIDGIPTTIDQMNQAQLRMFIPEMLKYSTGRGKPGWGQDNTRPPWWPQDVPWANVRRDARTNEAKLRVSWTQALRQVVKNCYRFHGREDLLLIMPSEQGTKLSAHNSRDKLIRPSSIVTPPTLVQTVHNADGSVSLVQLDSGQTIATISRDQSGTAVATLANAESEDAGMDISMEEMTTSEWGLGDQDTAIGDAYNVITSVGGDGNVQKQQTSGISLSFATNGQIINSSALSDGDNVTIPQDDDTSAMVQIPVSVYEKIAHTIQSGVHSTVSISADGRIQLQPPIISIQQQEDEKSPSKSENQEIRSPEHGAGGTEVDEAGSSRTHETTI